MKKHFGFSLTELLLVLSIIGIVSAMGVAYSRKSMESAFNLYYYTGYSNLLKALEVADGIYDEEDESTHLGGASYNEAIAETLSIQETIGTQIVAKNGITYELGMDNGDFKIIMTLPGVIKNPNGESPEIILVYKDAVRAAEGEGDNKVDKVLIIPDTEGLSIRKDLLTFYADDYNIGRIVQIYDTVHNTFSSDFKDPDNSFVKEYLSFKDAFCSMYNSVDGYVNCVGGHSNQITNTVPDKRNYKLRVANPQKVL